MKTAKSFSLLILLALLMFIPGCESEPKNTAPVEAPGQPKTIALVMKTLTNPFFIEMEQGARKAESELGVNLIVKTGAQETSIEQQIAIVDEMIHKKVDAIVIAPGDSVALIPVLKKAKEAGIPIINIDNRLDPAVCAQLGLIDVPFISVNNEEGAYLSAKYISDQIKTPTKVVILEGIRSAKNAEDRKNGALRAFKENPQITMVAQETANWKIDEAYTVSKKLFSSQPDIGAVFCANDMMALGTIEYLKESGRKSVLVAGYDALDEAKKEIRAGMLQVTINQQADIQGYLGVKMAVQAIGGEKLPPETLVDVKVVSKENL